MSQTKSSKPRTAASPKGARKKLVMNRILTGVIVVELGVLAYFGGLFLWQHYRPQPKKSQAVPTKAEQQSPQYGKIVSADTPVVYSTSQTEALIKQTDAAFTMPVKYGLTKQVFSYTSSDPRDNSTITVFGRAYVPTGATSAKLPVVAFAPGTTGLADNCAASLEDPAKRNWANYDSLLAAYASQGYIVVVTDYAGMRDQNRLHPYMVGDSEGRAVLDSLRAAKNLSLTREVVDSAKMTVAGYSQGGHAVLWADQIQASYAPELKLRGVATYGPVSSVTETLADVTHGATIDWFGPYLLVSYGDYYHQYLPVNDILQARYASSLNANVQNSCIDTVSRFWPSSAAQVYTPNFVAAMKATNFSGTFAALGDDMAKNDLTSSASQTPTLINQGQLDTVILPSQSQNFDRHRQRQS